MEHPRVESPVINIVIGGEPLRLTWANTRVNTFSPDWAHMNYVFVDEASRDVALFGAEALVAQLQAAYYPELRWPVPTEVDMERYGKYIHVLTEEINPEDFVV